jgi:hypothetical protein
MGTEIGAGLSPTRTDPDFIEPPTWEIYEAALMARFDLACQGFFVEKVLEKLGTTETTTLAIKREVGGRSYRLSGVFPELFRPCLFSLIMAQRRQYDHAIRRHRNIVWQLHA